MSVVDASVAVKWVVAEDLSALAQTLYDDTIALEHMLAVPPHLVSEVTNALYRRALRTGPLAISADEARTAVRCFLALRVQVVTRTSLYDEAFAFAHAHSLGTIYDSLYVVLAQHLGTVLWTADQRLLTATRVAAPWVRWIGDYTPNAASP